jgi:hypothetical protein
MAEVTARSGPGAAVLDTYQGVERDRSRVRLPERSVYGDRYAHRTEDCAVIVAKIAELERAVDVQT